MNLSELKILLADDDADDCLFFKDAVTAFIPTKNFRAVHDGEQLMQLLKNETTNLPDILFLDLNMPRKNGFECLTEIKQNQKLKNLRVIIFSTSNVPDSMHVLFKTGADIYIRKPRDFNQLVQIIQHALPMTAENITGKEKLKYILNA